MNRNTNNRNILTPLLIVFLILSNLIHSQVKIILDTDMASDCDDAGALAVLNVLADRGEAKILAVVTNGKDLSNASAAAVDVINTYYGRPNIPIGTNKNRAKVQYQKGSAFTFCLLYTSDAADE